MSFAMTLLFLVFLPAFGSSCDQGAMTTKSSECIGQMSANIGQGMCPAWNAYVCCLKDAYASCGSDMSAQIDTIVNTMKSTYSSQAQFADISNCAEASCSGGGQTPSGQTSAPSKVESIIEAMIELSDPTTFNLQSYIEAVKNKTGASTVPVAELKAWEIVLQYSVPDGTTEAAMKAAIAKAMNVVENAIKIVMASGGRRLLNKRRLAATADVTITTDTAAKAQTLKIASAGTAAIDTVTSELGGPVTVAKNPKAIAKVETKITVETSKVSDLKGHVQSAGSDIGGTITVNTESTTPKVGGAASSSSWSLTFAPFLILLTKMLQ